MKILFMLIFGLTLTFLTSSVHAQEDADDTISIKTRVVFVDALVRDLRTSESVTDLTRDDFEVLDNSKPRRISYFSRENDRQRPLALMLVLAPLNNGAAKNLQRPEIINSLANALAKLPPADEVAVMLVWRNGVNRMLVDFTHDRAKVTSALTTLPKWTEAKPFVEAIKVIEDTTLAMAQKRPNSQVNAILVTDSGFLISHAARNRIIENMNRVNVTFNTLITGSDLFFTLFSPVLKSAESDSGASFYDVPQFIARQTGGHYVRARKKKDYGTALEILIGSVAARYSIGFTLNEDELDYGQMHRLDVRVKARDSQGRERTVEVNARQGYYTPKK